LIGIFVFAERAENSTIPQLSQVEAVHLIGANLEAALVQCRRALGGAPGCALVFSWFDITSHLVNGEPWFGVPTSPAALRATLEEIDRCADAGLTVNAFRFHQPTWHESPRGDLIIRAIIAAGGRATDVSRETALAETARYLADM
jgi:uncharacterized protein with von Willebrand factor type A (vWA) domain